MAGPDDAPVTRAEHEALRRRVDALELEVRGPRTPPVVPAVASPPPPPAVRLPPPPAPPAKPAVAMETLLGERLAPRVGALLVFLAALFFLGVGIQRGWIGPLAQLGIAVLAAAALLAAGAYLTRQRGYGRYPQILEGTAACVLYATAFVAERLPYYQRVTHLDATAGAVLLAAVAAGTVALALWRDARVIAGLGFALAFLAAGLDLETFPTFTVAYVALLGAALAGLVLRKGWVREALFGTIVTGAFFLRFGYDAGSPGGAPVGLVVACALAAAGAYVALALKPGAARRDAILPVVAAVTLAWAVMATLLPFEGDDRGIGAGLLAWTGAALALVGVGRHRGAAGDVVATFAVAAVALHAAWPFWLLEGPSATMLRVGLWSATALLVAVAHRAAPTPAGVWYAGVALAAVAAFQGTAPGGYALPSTADAEAVLQAALVVGALLALHHVRDPARVKADGATLGGLLVGGGAAVVAAVVARQIEGPVVSVLLGVAGVVYLVAGFLLAGEKPYRYTGFALLGLVVLRVFVVDLDNADLVVRALVFLVLGGILLGVGYAYARMARARHREAEPPTPPAP